LAQGSNPGQIQVSSFLASHIVSSKMMKVTAFALAVGTAQGASHGADNCGNQALKTATGVSYKKDWTKKATLTSLYCSSSAVTQTTCVTGCCQVDTTKCGASDPSCATGKFWDMTKSQTARGADATAAKTNCCTAQAKCSTMTCPAGYVLDTTKSNNYCKGAACNPILDLGCCKADATKCASKIGQDCGAATGKFQDSTKYGNAIGADWKATSACCSQSAVCTGYTGCPAGKKLKAAHATTYCSGTACSTSSTADQAKCCEADTTKCGGTVVTCDAGKFKDSSKAGTAKGADAKAACCTAKAKCAVAVCSTGMKLKSNAATLYCAGAACVATTTTKAGDTSTCCENDTTKCLGATVTCDAGQYKDSAKNGATAGTGAAMKTNCCTAKTTCDAFIKADLSGTTKGSTSAAWQPKGQVMQVVVALATVLSVNQFWL